MSHETRESRAVWFRLSALAFGTLLAAGLVAGAAWGYVAWKVAAREEIDPRMRSIAAIRNSYRDPAYKALMQAIAAGREDAFETTWDFDNAIALDKNLFVPTEMFGRTKYRYRPGAGVLNAVVWTGLKNQSLVVGADAEVRARLDDCELQRATYFETDSRGFKPTPGTSSGTAPAILMLGDSFTEGLYVRPEETFVTRFAEKLAAAGLAGQTLNLGVNGFSALEMAWMVEEYAEDLEARVIVANLFPNDVHARYNEVVQGRGAGADDYREMFSYLDSMRVHCENHDCLFAVSLIPSKQQFAELRGHGVFQDRVLAWCSEAEVLCLDPREHFDEVGAENVYFSWDPHFSEAGHGHYAEFLYRRLSSDLTAALGRIDEVVVARESR